MMPFRVTFLIIFGIVFFYFVEGVPQRREAEARQYNHQRDTRFQKQDDIQGSIAAAVSPVAEYSDWYNETRQRDKAMRLKRIELSILEALGRSNKPSTSTPASSGTKTKVHVIEKGIETDFSNSTSNNKHHHIRNNNAFPGQLNSYQASCDLPSKVDAEAWMQPDFFRIFFNLTALEDQNKNMSHHLEPTSLQGQPKQSSTIFPFLSELISKNGSEVLRPRAPINRRAARNNINIISAKLRLYKIGRGPNAEPPQFDLPKTSEFCNNTNDEIAAHQQRQHQSQPTSSIVSENPTQVEEKIFVKVYWYNAPVTKHHYKKKLLYSRTLLVKKSGWVDFDIQRAAKTWIQSNTNFGLVLEVENEDNDLVDVGLYFSNVKCPITTNVTNTNGLSSPNQTRPRGQQQAIQSEPINYPSPILELCTLTLPVTQGGDPVISYYLSSVPLKVGEMKMSDSGNVGGLDSQDETQFWQNDDNFQSSTTSTLPPYHHRRRHHHGSLRRTFSVQNQHRREFTNSMMQADSPVDITATETKAKPFMTPEEMYKRQNQHDRSFSWTGRHGEEESIGRGDSEDETRFQPIIVEAENILIENNNAQKR